LPGIPVARSGEPEPQPSERPASPAGSTVEPLKGHWMFCKPMIKGEGSRDR
jgi:hypothetical protein